VEGTSNSLTGDRSISDRTKELLMDAVALLVADHNRVRGLVARNEDAHDSGDLDEAAKLVAKIVEELEVHMAIEEEVFYPAIHELKDEIGESVDEGIEEHHVAKVLIKELGSLQPTDESWVAKVTVLIESVEHHVDEEEEELFPRVRGASNAAWLKVLAGKLESKKKALGAPVLADKIDMPKSELEALARAQKIPGRSSMDQEQLAATVSPR
jgi:iron-sulfur cluster repair protein YtfE (RIC family)